jgi:integrase
MAKVTKRNVDALKPRVVIKDGKQDPRDNFIWDDEVRGFGCKVTPKGNKTFVLQYRLGGRAEYARRYTIGSYGVWTPEQARDEAKRLKREFVDRGKHPIDDKRERVRAATEFTVKALAERFGEYVKGKWKKSHNLADQAMRLRILPAIGSKPIASVDEGDIEALLASIPEKMKGARRNTYAVLQRFFSWAVAARDIPLDSSPLTRVDAPEPPAEREHTLADWELRLAWLAAGNIGYPFGPLYRLLMLTGQRREEVGGLDWRELDRSAAEWQLPASRSKNGVANTIHLTDDAIAELDSIAGGDKWPRRGLVFTTTGTTAVSGHSRGKRRLDAEIADLNAKEAQAAGEDASPVSPFRVHDFRRTMATGLQRLGFRWEVIEACENRISGQARKGAGSIYQRHDWGPEKIRAWQAWAAQVDQLATRSDASNVVRLPSLAS